MNTNRILRVVTLGGATGHSQLLAALKRVPNLQVTSICTASDAGGSTGKLTAEYKRLGVGGWLGDLTRLLGVLGSNSELIGKHAYRFPGGSLHRQSAKNLIATSLTAALGPVAALEQLHSIYQVPSRYRIMPATLTAGVHLKARLRNGKTLPNETAIDNLAKEKLWVAGEHSIIRVWLSPKAKANADAIRAIEQADVIVYAPGDLYTSLIPALLPTGISQAIASSKAHLVMLANIVSKRGETDGYSLGDFVAQLVRYGGRIPDTALCAGGDLPTDVMRRYEREHKAAVIPNHLGGDAAHHTRVVVGSLWQLDEHRRLVHNPAKTARLLQREVFSKLRG